MKWLLLLAVALVGRDTRGLAACDDRPSDRADGRPRECPFDDAYNGLFSACKDPFARIGART